VRIVVNDIAASSGGAMSVLKDFYSYIREKDTKNEWIFLLGDHYLEETPLIKVVILPEIKRSWARRFFFDIIFGKKFINSFEPDVVLSLQNIITIGVACPQIVYIHQAIPFQNSKTFSFFRKNERVLAVYQHFIGALIKLSARRADKVVVQTNWMKEAVCDRAGVKEDKVIVIPPSIDLKLDKRNRVSPKRNSFFYPTSDVIYKNNECAYEATQILYSQGIRDFKLKMTLSERHEGINTEFIGIIPREQVFYEYYKSTLIFPSYIESYSLPLMEARMAGAIVLASDCPFSREVLNGYENAYLFDPFNPKELACLMEKVITSQIVKRNTNYRAPAASKNDRLKSLIDFTKKLI